MRKQIEDQQSKEKQQNTKKARFAKRILYCSGVIIFCVFVHQVRMVVQFDGRASLCVAILRVAKRVLSSCPFHLIATVVYVFALVVCNTC